MKEGGADLQLRPSFGALLSLGLPFGSEALATISYNFKDFSVAKGLKMLASLTASRTWQLDVFVTDLNVSKSIEVNGQTHVGQVMLDLVEKLGKQERTVTSPW